MSYRIGFGIDFHQLVEGRELWIGGVNIEHNKGVLLFSQSRQAAKKVRGWQMTVDGKTLCPLLFSESSCD